MDFSQPLKKVLRENYPTVKTDDSLETALRTMAGDDSSALLVQEGGDLVGVITISDIMYSLVNGDDPGEVKVSTFMTGCELISSMKSKQPCAQLDEDEDILSAIKVMNEAGVNHLLVSGSGGEPAGMVSSLEIIKHLIS